MIVKRISISSFRRANARFCPRAVTVVLSGLLAIQFAFFQPPVFAEKQDSQQVSQNSNGPLKVFQTIPSIKSLRSSPQFAVVDDFNTGVFKNKSGVSWRTKVPGEGALDLNIVKEDGRNPERGYSLKADFNLNPNEEAVLQSFLPQMDVSQASYFVFKYRLKTNEQHRFRGHLLLTLTDWKHNTVTVPVERMDNAAAGEWLDAIFPMKNFSALDLNQLVSMQLTFKANKEKIQGSLWIDEVAFFGFNNLAFESNRDNLNGYPKTTFAYERRKKLLEIKNDKKLLLEIAKDTWQYFENARDKQTFLIVDHLGLGETPLAADYTSITNIAMDLLSTAAAAELEFLSKEDAGQRVAKILETLKDMRRYKNFFYNYYNTKTLTVTRSYISTVDSGWLAVALVVVRQVFGGEIAKEATAFLDSFHFGEFIDPENNHMVVGLDVPERNFGIYHYGMLVSEARVTSFYAIGKGDVPRDHWWYLFRTPPESWKWQNQKPQGRYVKYDGMEVFQGYYEHQGRKFVPSWGGSLFEFLMPTLVLDEKKLAKSGLGRNDKIAAEIQRDYALKEKGYPVWGISPAAMLNGRKWRYVEYGVKALSVKGYPDHQVVSPHASFLALDVLPDDAISNIRKLLEYDLYGEYGFFDALDLRSGKAVPQYLALDQGMTLVALCNYLKKGFIQKAFAKDPIAQNAEKLLSKENFF